MIIIGEKINGFIPRTLQAIEAKDEKYIREIAKAQADYGATYIDVCAGTAPEIERETLKWLIGLVQDTVDTPLSLDSSDVNVILEMIPLAKKPGIINSISGEEGKCEAILPALKGTDWNVVALTCDQNGIPTDPAVKLQIATNIIEQAKANDISVDRLYIDPLVTTLATTADSLINFNAAVRLIKEKYPDVHITSGLSNISFGMPFRKAINMQFLALAMSAGMDSAIMDPTSADMRMTMYATDALLGNDEYCMRYLKAFRDGVIGPPKKA
ncbi:MAG: methyltetrahydrofolate cobalamin methyltransferase [Clostridiales Family XIII bacterium]|jgi:5-methyltetrahydrofolate--homocysteine methyltransferase|nr:methyltetrahydrofolate cobalamin methyltransferase [Clostridiales Family XIII bacterium]